MATLIATPREFRADSQRGAYLALLAARAITGLADLADDPKAWNDRIRTDLMAGVRFCCVLRADLTRATITPATSSRHTVRRLTADNRDRGFSVSAEDVRRVEAYMRSLIAQRQPANVKEVHEVIEFFVNASSAQLRDARK